MCDFRELSAHTRLRSQDVAALCQAEKDSGNQSSFCIEYLLASTEYDAFLQVLDTDTSPHP